MDGLSECVKILLQRENFSDVLNSYDIDNLNFCCSEYKSRLIDNIMQNSLAMFSTACFFATTIGVNISSIVFAKKLSHKIKAVSALALTTGFAYILVNASLYDSGRIIECINELLLNR